MTKLVLVPCTPPNAPSPLGGVDFPKRLLSVGPGFKVIGNGEPEISCPPTRPWIVYDPAIVATVEIVMKPVGPEEAFSTVGIPADETKVKEKLPAGQVGIVLFSESKQRTSVGDTTPAVATMGTVGNRESVEGEPTETETVRFKPGFPTSVPLEVIVIAIDAGAKVAIKH